jgi:poly(ADP-ribose) glycohydrolase ARH3
MVAVLMSLNRMNGNVDQIDMIRQIGAVFAREHHYSDRTGALIGKLSSLPDPAGWREITFAKEHNRTTYESNGCAMRISPVGLAALHASDAELRRMVTAACEITHPAPIATEGAIAVAKATQLALRASSQDRQAQLDRREFMDRVIKTIRISPHANAPPVLEFIRRLERARSFLQEVEELERSSPEQARLRETERLRDSDFLGVGFKINNCVPAAIYLAARYLSNYELGMNRAVHISLNGDTDTVPAMSGAIIGAFLGVDAIPQRWISQLYDANDDGSPSQAWLDQWKEIWLVKENLASDVVPKRFDLTFLPLRRFRGETAKLSAILAAGGSSTRR